MSQTFVPDPEPFVPDERPNLVSRLGRQAVSGALRAPVDATFGLLGAVGVRPAERVAQGYGDTIDNMMGTTEPNWRQEPAEFVARQVGGAVVGLPARALGFLGRTANPGLRALEVITPLTLPVTTRNVLLNAAAGSVITAGIQEAQAYENNAQEAAAFVPDVEPMQQTTQQRLAIDNEPFTPDRSEEGPRTIAGQVLNALPYGLVGVLGGAAGISAARQYMRNRAAVDATQGGNVSNSAQPTGNYQPGAIETASNQTLDDTIIAQNAQTRLAEAGIIPQRTAVETNEGFALNVNAAPVLEQAAETARSGNYLDTGITSVPLDVLEQRLAAFAETNPQRYAIANDAVTAMDELQSRAFMRQIDPNNPDPRRMLSSKDDAELQADVARGRADPEVSRYMDDFGTVSRALREVAVREGLASQATVNKWTSVNPHWIHTFDPGKSPFTRRDYKPDQVPEQYANPLAAQRAALTEYTVAVLNNRQARTLIDAAKALNAVRSDGASMFGIGRVGDAATLRKDMSSDMGLVTAKYGDDTIAVEVIKPIQAAYYTSPRAFMPIMSGVADVIRSATVGKMAAVAGYLQAPVSTAFGAMATIGSRPAGTSAGYLDNLALRTTGRNLPIGDLTFLPQTVVAGLKGVTAESARAFASALDRSIMSNGQLVSVLGAQGAQRLSNRLKQIYAASEVARARQYGSIGTGVVSEGSGVGGNSIANMITDPGLRRMLPRDMSANGFAAAKDFVAFHTRQLTPDVAKRSWDFLGSILEVLSSAHTLAYTAQNRGRLPERVLQATARRLAGDPASRGANVGVQMLTSAAPFSNTTMQGIRAHSRAFRENPARYITTYAGAAASLGMLSYASALFADEQEGGTRHIEYMLNAPAHELVRGINVSIPGLDPRNSLRIPVDPTISPAFAAVQGAVPIIFGMQAEQAGPAAQLMNQSIQSFMSDRFVNMMNTSAVSGLDPTDAFRQLLTTLLGTGDRQIDQGAVGYENSRLFGGNIAASTSKLLSAVGGLAASQLVLVVERMGITGDVATSLRSWQADFAARQRIAGPLLQGARTDSPRGAIAEALMPYENKFTEVVRGYPDVTRPGTVGAGNAVQPAMSGRQQPDSEIIPTLAAMREVHTALAPVRQQRDAVRQRITDINSNPQRFEDERQLRNAVNEEVAILRRYDALIYNAYNQLERQERRRLGREVNLSRIDPTRGIDQFSPVNAP